jgi:hypothetical protein
VGLTHPRSPAYRTTFLSSQPPTKSRITLPIQTDNSITIGSVT